MASVYPFRGTRYCTERPADLASLVAPPFDVISAAMRQDLISRSAHNVVRLTLPEADGARGKFVVSAGLLDEWLSEGVLERDDEPALYVYTHLFELEGRKMERKGFFAALDIEESGELVRGHEQTISGPKEDRLNLLAETRAFFGPVFMLYPDTEGRVRKVLHKAATVVSESFSRDGETHSLEIIRDRDIHDVIHRVLLPETFVIADGHHRFSASVQNYRNTAAGSDSMWQRRTLVFCVASNDPGLVILPAHRLVRKHGICGEGILERLGALGSIERVACMGDVMRLLGSGRDHVFGVCVKGLDAFYVLRRESKGLLDVEDLHCVMESAFAADGGFDLSYDHSAVSGVRSVQDGRNDVCLLLGGVTADQLLDYARRGRYMPPKATYFYPKPLTGLVIKEHR